MDRRTFLSASGIVAAAGLAGCTSLSDDTPDGVVLSMIELGNATDEAQTFDVLVEHDGDIVYWEAHEIEPSGAGQQMGSDRFTPTVPEEPGSVVVHARVGDRWTTTDFVEGGFDGECVVATFLYGFRGDDVLSAHPISADALEGQDDLPACPIESE